MRIGGYLVIALSMHELGILCIALGGKEAGQLYALYKVEMQRDGIRIIFLSTDMETLEIVLLPRSYLNASRSGQTVPRIHSE